MQKDARIYVYCQNGPMFIVDMRLMLNRALGQWAARRTSQLPGGRCRNVRVTEQIHWYIYPDKVQKRKRDNT